MGTHPRTKGALRFAGGPPAGKRRYQMGSLSALGKVLRLPIELGEKRGSQHQRDPMRSMHRTC